MRNRNLIALAVTTALGMGFSSFATAGLSTCVDSGSGVTRTWSFNSAEACGTGPGNPNSSADIEALGAPYFDLGNNGATNGDADDWDADDGISSGGDSSPWLDVALLTGSWGGTSITATWTLAAGFWDAFNHAIFTVHVGGAPGIAPDDFGAFYITPGEYSGTWSFLQDPLTGAGGGLSNARLWYSDSGTIIDNPAEVPEPGILLLLGTGLLGLGLSRKRKAKV